MSAIPWLLALALLQRSAPPPVAPASLRELVGQSELVAWVRVADVREIDLRSNQNVGRAQMAPFADLRIESIVSGAGEPEAVLARLGAEWPASSALTLGARALVFLSRDTAGGWSVLSGGDWCLAPDGERLRRPSLAPPEPLGDGRTVPRATFAMELELTLDLELPRLEISNISTGPSPYMLSVAPDGNVRGTYTAQLGGDALREIWDLFQRERFFDLPETVGVPSRWTCAPFHHLTVVTRRSRHKVWIRAGRLEGLAPGDLRDATERALRLWDAVHTLDIPAWRPR